MVPVYHRTFASLVAVQALHSIEECWGRLWESYPPARFVAGLISTDLARGFIIGNVVLVAFGVWCYFWPVRRGWALGVALAWFWTFIETVNGLGHPLWSVWQGGYTAGVATAPVLLVLAIMLALQLRRHRPA